ncbi:MAG: hypothetical protein ACM3XR_11675 [Bacillota bacterium]
MEDKTFELLTKMYSEFSVRFDKVEADMQGVKNHVGRLENKLTAMEFELKKDISALYDGYKQTCEKLEVIEEKVDNLSEKVDRHDIKIQVIEGGRK